MKSVTAFSAVVFCSVWMTTEPRSLIIAQDSCPIQIWKYEAKYQHSTEWVTREHGIKHDIEYGIRSDQGKVVAVEFGIASFSVFREFLGAAKALDMQETIAGSYSRGSWIQNGPELTIDGVPYFPHYASHYTSIVYVDRVRFADDTFWIADLQEVIENATQLLPWLDAEEIEAGLRKAEPVTKA